jgi:hypothetical protein
MLLFTGKPLGICPSRPVSEREGARLVAAYLGRQPSAANQDFRSAAQAALSDAFPCEGKDGDP